MTSLTALAPGVHAADISGAGATGPTASTIVSATGTASRFAPAARASQVPATGPWSAFGGSGDGAINGRVNAIAVSGRVAYVAGVFTNAGGVSGANFIARWDGIKWSAVGPPNALNDQVHALAVSGGDLYVGGRFTDAAGIAAADHVAKWNGSKWSALGAGPDGAITSWVYALAATGSGLYVGGDFINAGGIAAADYVARWNGSAWSSLGSNGGEGAITPSPNAPSPAVYALAAAGPAVYVGGSFIDVMGIPEADDMVTWDGNAWSAMGSGDCNHGCGAFDSAVYALAMAGTDLYAGGAFVDVGSTAGDYVAKWDGSAWSALGTGSPDDGAIWNGNVNALAVAGTDVFAGGEFLNAAGNPNADRIARWDGSSWNAMGSGDSDGGALNGAVNALTVTPSGSDLLVGGEFTEAAGIAAADHLALWGPPPAPTTLTIVAKARVASGSMAIVSGVLSSTDAACSKLQRVSFLKGGAFIGSKTTNANGAFSIPIKVTAKTVVKVTFAGSAFCKPSQSASRTINVT